MKRIQVAVTDETYARLREEAKRRARPMADLVRRGIDRQLESAVEAPRGEPTITPLHLGEILIPESEWRLLANERPLD
jgi:hypothetical protein